MHFRLWQGLLLLILGISPALRAQTPVPGDVILNEIMYDPPTGGSDEYVEIYNRSAQPWDLSRFRFADASSSALSITAASRVLPPDGYAVLVRDTSAFKARFPGVAFLRVASWPALNNTGDTPRLLFDPGGGQPLVEIDAVPYLTSWGGVDAALERRDPTGPSDARTNWTTTTDARGGTPGATNSVTTGPDTTPPAPVLVTALDVFTWEVRFSEALAVLTQASVAVRRGAEPIPLQFERGGSASTLVLAFSVPVFEAASYTVEVAGMADAAGNVTPAGTLFPYALPADLTAPALERIEPISFTEVELVFEEYVALSPTLLVEIDGIGAAAGVDLLPRPRRGLRATFAAPFVAGRPYTVTVRNVADYAGNVLAQASETFFFGEAPLPLPGEVIVNEILFDPPTGGADEYLELLNTTPDKTFDLRKLRFADETSTPVPLSEAPRFVFPGGYIVLVRDSLDFRATFPEVPFVVVSPWPTLNNDGDVVQVYATETDGSLRSLDAVPYEGTWGGVDAALERKDPAGPSAARSNWATTTDARRGTPGSQNSVFAPDLTGPLPVEVDVDPDERGLTVTFDEPLVGALPGLTLSPGPPIASVRASLLDPAQLRVSLAAPLTTAATYTVTVENAQDIKGNVTVSASLSFAFAPDRTGPVVTLAVVTTPTTLDLRFSEPLDRVAAATPGNYAVREGVGIPTTAFVNATGDVVTLTFATPFTTGQVYTLTLANLRDPAGNALSTATVRLYFGTGAVPAAGDVVLSEIMFDPRTGNAEYVELFNRTEAVFDLRSFRLSDDGDRTQAPITSVPVFLLPGEYVVLTDDPVTLRATFAETLPEGAAVLDAGGFPSLNSGEDAVVLTYDAALVDSVFYQDGWHRPEVRETRGLALERIAADGPSTEAGNWTSSLDPLGGTPGRANSVFVDPDGPPPATPGLRIDSPFAPDEGQSTRIQYALEAPAALVRVRVFDGAGRPVRELEAAVLSGQEGFVDWDGRDEEGRPLRIGPYIVLLEALDAVGGTTEAHRNVVVLARRL